MKQLDEMERMAREWTEEYQSSLPVGELSNELARALLAVMPVVRAAEAWLKQPGIDWQRTQGSAFGRANHELANAIDELRRRLGGE